MLMIELRFHDGHLIRGGDLPSSTITMSYDELSFFHVGGMKNYLIIHDDVEQALYPQKMKFLDLSKTRIKRKRSIRWKQTIIYRSISTDKQTITVKVYRWKVLR